jgi:hypothetical protein
VLGTAPKLHCKMAPVTTWRGMSASSRLWRIVHITRSAFRYTSFASNFPFYWQTNDSMLTRRAYADLQWRLRHERGDPWRSASRTIKG